MLREKFDHKAIEQPRLLYLASVAGARQCSQLTIGYARLQREGALMAVVFAAGQNDRRTGDTLMMAFRVGRRERFELMDDGLHVCVLIAFNEEVRKEVRQGSRAKRRTEIFERVGPAIIEAAGLVVGDPPLREFLVGVVTGAR